MAKKTAIGKGFVSSCIRNNTQAQMNAVSMEVKKNRESITMLKLDDLVESEYEYAIYNKEDETSDGLVSMAKDISERGIQQALNVIPSEDMGKYEIISGHRRVAAVHLAIEKFGYDASGGIPCQIGSRPKRGKEYEMLENIILDNLQRERQPYERLREVEAMKKCAEQRRNAGEKIPNMREYLKERLGISRSDLNRLLKIQSDLIPDLRQEFDLGHIPVSLAYEIANKDEKYQHIIADGWDHSNPDNEKLCITLMNQILGEHLVDSDDRKFDDEPDPENQDEVSTDAAENTGSDSDNPGEEPQKPAEEKVARKKVAADTAYIPETIDEGIDMLRTTFVGISNALSTPTIDIDKKAKKRLLKQISKQMASLVALQNELAELGIEIPKGTADGSV